MTDMTPINIEEIIKAFHELGGEATSREIQDQVIMNRGGDLPENFQVGGWDSYRKTIIQKVHNHCPGYQKYNSTQYFESIRKGKYRLIKSMNNDLSLPKRSFELPEEVDSSLFEGAKKQVLINSYERNNIAREKCISFYGTCCSICNFSFEKTYGPVGVNYIHVHHIIPLSEINMEYEVDPISDLRPVCPNCHAMLHQKSPAYTIEEMKKKLCK